MSTPQETIQQFAARVRQRYPGAYDDVPDHDLTDRILEKHPEYRSNVRLPEDPTRITSAWGSPRSYGGHTGADFGFRTGEEIAPPLPGRVVFAGRKGGYGNRVEIDHGNGLVTSYSHLNDFQVNVGDELEDGQLIGRVGSTGHSTGPHLHFEVLRDGRKVNPGNSIYRPLRAGQRSGLVNIEAPAPSNVNVNPQSKGVPPVPATPQTPQAGASSLPDVSLPPPVRMSIRPPTGLEAKDQLESLRPPQPPREGVTSTADTDVQLEPKVVTTSVPKTTDPEELYRHVLNSVGESEGLFGAPLHEWIEQTVEAKKQNGEPFFSRQDGTPYLSHEILHLASQVEGPAKVAASPKTLESARTFKQKRAARADDYQTAEGVPAASPAAKRPPASGEAVRVDVKPDATAESILYDAFRRVAKSADLSDELADQYARQIAAEGFVQGEDFVKRAKSAGKAAVVVKPENLELLRAYKGGEESGRNIESTIESETGVELPSMAEGRKALESDYWRSLGFESEPKTLEDVNSNKSLSRSTKDFLLVNARQSPDGSLSFDMRTLPSFQSYVMKTRDEQSDEREIQRIARSLTPEDRKEIDRRVEALISNPASYRPVHEALLSATAGNVTEAAGLLRTVRDVLGIEAADEWADFLRKRAYVAQSAVAEADRRSPMSAAQKTAAFGTNLVHDLLKLAALTEVVGPVAAFAGTGYARARGENKDVRRSGLEGFKGAATAGLLKVTAGMPIQTRVPTVAAGSYSAEKLSGASDEEAATAAATNTAFSAMPELARAIGLAGRAASRWIKPKGQESYALVRTTPEGRVRVEEVRDTPPEGTIETVEVEPGVYEAVVQSPKLLKGRVETSEPKTEAAEPPTAPVSPEVVSHPNPEIDGKPIVARTGDGRVVVPNESNKSGVSVVTPREQTNAGDTSTNQPARVGEEEVNAEPILREGGQADRAHYRGADEAGLVEGGGREPGLRPRTEPPTDAPPQSAEAEGVKEPWQMTRAEFEALPKAYRGINEHNRNNLGEIFITPDRKLARQHGKIVMEGRVLRDEHLRPDGEVEAFEDRPLSGRESFDLGSARIDYSRFAPDKHDVLVEQALREGKPVPAEVLADYPELTRPASARLQFRESPTPLTEFAEDVRRMEGEPVSQVHVEGLTKGDVRAASRRALEGVGETLEPLRAPKPPTRVHERWNQMGVRERGEYLSNLLPGADPGDLRRLAARRYSELPASTRSGVRTQMESEGASAYRSGPGRSRLDTQVHSASEALRRMGGIQFDRAYGGELRYIGNREGQTTGLVKRDSGMTVEQAAQNLREQGYPVSSDPNEFLSQVADDLSGARKLYSAEREIDYDAEYEKGKTDDDRRAEQAFERMMADKTLSPAFAKLVYNGVEDLTDEELRRLREAADREGVRRSFDASFGLEGLGEKDVPQAPGRTPSTSSGSQDRPVSLSRNYRAGSNDATLKFASELQRDLYDAGARLRARRTGSVYDTRRTDARELLESVASRLGVSVDDARSLAYDVHSDVKAQMKGVRHLEERSVVDNVLAKPPTSEAEDEPIPFAARRRADGRQQGLTLDELLPPPSVTRTRDLSAYDQSQAEYAKLEKSLSPELAVKVRGFQEEDQPQAVRSIGKLVESRAPVVESLGDEGRQRASDLLLATSKLRELKRTRTPVSDYLSQGNLFGDRELTPRQEAMLAGLEKNHRQTVDEYLPEPKKEESQGALFSAAWHGSPHRFEKFSTEKIGTGEGAQAFGHGLYFAEKEAVARYYRETLARTEYVYNGKPVEKLNTKRLDAASRAFFEKLRELGDPGVARDAAFYQIHPERATTAAGKQAERETWKKLLEVSEKLKGVKKGGALYKVELAPTDEELLFWDKPLGEQSEKVKAALARTELAKEYADSPNLWNLKNGAQIYRDLETRLGGQRQASEYLKSLGVRGIKYLEGVSRKAGEGGYNYVIFDDADVSIQAVYSLSPEQASDADAFALLRDLDYSQDAAGRVKVNPSTAEFMARLAEQMELEKQGGDMSKVGPAQRFTGQTLYPVRVGNTVKMLKRIAEALPEHKGKLKGLALALRDSQVKGGVALVYTDAASVPHEELHRLSVTASNFKPMIDRVDVQEGMRLPAFWRARDVLIDEFGYPENDALLIEETAAHLFEGRGVEFGVSEDDAVEFLDWWLSSFEARNGRISPEAFDRLMRSREEFLPDVRTGFGQRREGVQGLAGEGQGRLEGAPSPGAGAREVPIRAEASPASGPAGNLSARRREEVAPQLSSPLQAEAARIASKYGAPPDLYKRITPLLRRFYNLSREDAARLEEIKNRIEPEQPFIDLTGESVDAPLMSARRVDNGGMKWGTRREFNRKYLVHFDLGPEPESRVESIYREGFRSGHANTDIDNQTPEGGEGPALGRRAMARGWARWAGVDKPGAHAYVLDAKDVKNGRIKPGSKPVAHVVFTEENQSVYDLLTAGADASVRGGGAREEFRDRRGERGAVNLSDIAETRPFKFLGEQFKDPETGRVTFKSLFVNGRETPIRKIIPALRRAGLLSSIKMHVRNTAGNTAFAVTEEGARPIAALADIYASRKTGLRTTVAPSPLSVAKAVIGKEGAVIKGTADFWRTLWEGDPEAQAKYEREEFRSGLPVIDAYVNFVQNSVAASDRFAKAYHLSRALDDLAKVEARNERAKDASVNLRERAKELRHEPTDWMQREAIVRAEIGTFQDANEVTRVVTNAKQALERAGTLGKAVKFAVELKYPFTLTPSNIFARILEYTPAGFPISAYRYRQIGKGKARSEFDTKEEARRARFDRLLARARASADKKAVAEWESLTDRLGRVEERIDRLQESLSGRERSATAPLEAAVVDAHTSRAEARRRLEALRSRGELFEGATPEVHAAERELADAERRVTEAEAALSQGAEKGKAYLVELQRLDDLLAEQRGLVQERTRVQGEVRSRELRRAFNDQDEAVTRALADKFADEMFTKEEQARFAETFGRAGFGTTLGALAILLLSKGLLDLVGVTDYESEKDKFFAKRTAGVRDGSLKVPGTNYRITITGNPLGNALTALATAYEQVTRPSVSKVEKGIAAARGGVEIAKQNPFLRNELDSERDDRPYSEKMKEGIASFGASFVPRVGGEIGDVRDPVQRTPFRAGPLAQFAAKSPLVSLRAPMKQTKTPLPDRGDTLRRALRLLDPFDLSRQQGATPLSGSLDADKKDEMKPLRPPRPPKPPKPRMTR